MVVDNLARPSTETQRFLEAERQAEQLVETLRALQQEIASYQTAGAELEAVRGKLVRLIEETQAIAGDTHEVVHTLQAIGGPEILKGIEGLSEQIREGMSAQRQELSTLSDELHGLHNLSEQIVGSGARHTEALNQHGRQITDLATAQAEHRGLSQQIADETARQTTALEAIAQEISQGATAHTQRLDELASQLAQATSSQREALAASSQQIVDHAAEHHRLLAQQLSERAEHHERLLSGLKTLLLVVLATAVLSLVASVVGAVR